MARWHSTVAEASTERDLVRVEEKVATPEAMLQLSKKKQLGWTCRCCTLSALSTYSRISAQGHLFPAYPQSLSRDSEWWWWWCGVLGGQKLRGFGGGTHTHRKGGGAAKCSPHVISRCHGDEIYRKLPLPVGIAAKSCSSLTFF